jgi:hypothetical protein
MNAKTVVQQQRKVPLLVELKLSLRTRLARQTHARPVKKFIAGPALRLC